MRKAPLKHKRLRLKLPGRRDLLLALQVVRWAVVKRLAVRFGGYSKHCHRLGARTEVPVHAPAGCHADVCMASASGGTRLFVLMRVGI